MEYFLNDSKCVAYTSKNNKNVGLGNLMIVEYAGNDKSLKGKFVVVTKSTRKGYEFSGKIVLPGGMTRCKNIHELNTFQNRISDLQRLSVLNRVALEIGLKEEDLSNIEQIPIQEEVYTKYSTKDGKTRYTKISVWGSSTRKKELKSFDDSTFNPEWLGVEDLGHKLEWAPANLYVLRKYLHLKNQFKNIPEKTLKAISNAKKICLNVKKEI